MIYPRYDDAGLIRAIEHKIRSINNRADKPARGLTYEDGLVDFELLAQDGKLFGMGQEFNAEEDFMLPPHIVVKHGFDIAPSVVRAFGSSEYIGFVYVYIIHTISFDRKHISPWITAIANEFTTKPGFFDPEPDYLGCPIGLKRSGPIEIDPYAALGESNKTLSQVRIRVPFETTFATT